MAENAMKIRLQSNTRSEMLRCVVCTVLAIDNAMSDPQGARKLGRASCIVSSVGMLVTIVIGVICAVVIGAYAANCHEYNGVCYKHKKHIFSASDCLNQYNGVYHNSHCYYN